MKLKKFIPDEESTWIQFHKIRPGCGVRMIKIEQNIGPDFILPEQYQSDFEVNSAIKRLKEAYALGKQMQARNITAGLESKT